MAFLGVMILSYGSNPILANGILALETACASYRLLVSILFIFITPLAGGGWMLRGGGLDPGWGGHSWLEYHPLYQRLWV